MTTKELHKADIIRKKTEKLPKAGIIRMFLDGHNLDSIVAKLFNAR